MERHSIGDSGQVGNGDPSSRLPVDSMSGFRQGDALAPEWGAQVFLRAAVSFLEAGVFFCGQDGHAARGGSAHFEQSGSTYHRSSDSHNQGAQ